MPRHSGGRRLQGAGGEPGHLLRPRQRLPGLPQGAHRGKRGPIVTVDGKEVGAHAGTHLYTIGQRKGIGVPYKEALYVVGIRAAENVVVVGPREALLRTALRRRT